jgi:hypothetical protein
VSEPSEPAATVGSGPFASRWLTAAVLAVLLSPLAVALVVNLVDGTDNPGGDQAIMEVRVRDVGGDGTPTLGSYSRFGVNHPGPAWLYAQALPYRLLGADYAGMQAAALLAGMASLAGIVLVARRLGGPTVMVLAAALSAVLVHTLGVAWVADPWEPKALVLPCAALLMLTLATVAGRSWALLAVAAVAAAIGQTYAVMLVFCLAMGAVAAIAVARRAVVDPHERSRALHALAWSGLAVLVVWAPPLVQQVRGDQGNLTAFADVLRDSDDPMLGLGPAWRTVSNQVGASGQWLGAEWPLAGLAGVVDTDDLDVVPIGLLVMGVAVAATWRRRGSTPPALLAGIVLVAGVAGLVSLSRLVGELFVWIPSWTLVLGLGTWLAVWWCGVVALRAWRPFLADRVAPIGLGIGLLALTAVTISGAADRPDPVAITEAVEAMATRAAPDLDEPVLVASDVTHTQVFGGTGVGLPALVLTLERAGVDVRVEPELANQFGAHRAQPEEARTELRLVEADAPRPDGFTMIEQVDPLSPAERAERAEILERLPVLADPGAEALRQVAHLIDTDPEAARQIERYQALSDVPALALVARSNG